MVDSYPARAAALDRLFHALSDPTRRAILRLTASDAKSVGDLARPFRMSLAAVSKHLKVLERADLITRRKRGSFQYIRTNARPMRQAQQWLGYYEQFWNERLDQLEDSFRKAGAE